MLSPKDFVPDSLNHVLFISLHVRAVELVILVKPIYILALVLMSISFGTKIPTLLGQLGSQLIVKRLETVAYEAKDK